MRHSLALALILLIAVTSSPLLGQSNLLPSGVHAANAGGGLTMNDVQSFASASIGVTYAARFDLTLSTSILARNIVSEVRDAKAHSFSISYTFLRGERSGIAAALQYSYGVHTASVKGWTSSILGVTYHEESRHTNTIALAAGRLVTDPDGFHVVPSLALGYTMASNEEPGDQAAMVVAAEFMFLIPAGGVQVLPYVGIGLVDAATVYAGGLRILIPFGGRSVGKE